MKIHNFSAGPSILPKEVFEQAAQGVLNLQGSGLSVLEISHRSDAFEAIIDTARNLVRELLQVPSSHHILFLSGGASTQFFMTAMNCLSADGVAGFIDTGAWSKKAIKEAQSFGQLAVVASSEDRGYTYIPKQYEVPANAAYLHFTSNNTIFGTQFHDVPEVSVPLVCDMSSDIFSRTLDLDKFGIVYAGAQKNMGPAGTTLVIVREDMLGKVDRQIPTMLNYQTHIDKQSMFHTPPVFPIYVSMLTLQWLKDRGGIPFAAQRNAQKAQLLYKEIDRNPLFKGVVEPDDRSFMNATFRLEQDDQLDIFLDLCAEAGCHGIKGHRSVGGFRASMYNAMDIESVQALVDVMQHFENKHG